jgi:hypothetical protein
MNRRRCYSIGIDTRCHHKANKVNVVNQQKPGSTLVALAIMLAACASENDAARQKRHVAAPSVVDLSVDGHTFHAPDTLEAGWITFRFANNGDDIHYAHIVRLESGRTAQEVLDAYAEAIRTSAPRPTSLTRFGGPGGAAPGDTSNVTEYLEPGRYVWLCPIEDNAGHPHFSKGEFTTFIVRAPDSGAAERAAPPTSTASIFLEDYSFALDSMLPRGQQTIRVRNTGAQGHDLVMMKLAPGKTAEDVARSMNPERARRPGQKDEPAEPLETLIRPGGGGIAAIHPGMEAFFTTNLTPGEYVLVCMATAPDGRSHIEHGMVRQIRID